MITLITGLPGNGKTLYTLVYVKQMAERENRPVFYHGIKDLALPWHVIPARTEKINGTDIQVPEWWTAPTNSIVVIDEAQFAGFGVRPRGMVPEWGQKLETHRHLGIDIFLITQDPSLIDSHDRKLCELHFHVMRIFGMQMATIHEFRPVRENVLKSRKGSIEHKWKYPKEAYAYYKSAEAHTHKVRIPAKVILLFAIPFFIAAMGYIAWTKYLSPDRESIKQATATNTAQPAAAAPRGPLSTADYVKQFEPRIKGLAYTAPVYDEVTKPTRAPIPTACISTKSRCACYSEQGTKLETPDDLCRSIVSGGFYVAWQTDRNNPQAQRPPAPVAVQREAPQTYIDNFHGFDAGDIRGQPIQDIRSKRQEVQDGEPRGRGYALPPVSQAKQ